ncbi:DUF3053 family protein [Comamonas testosteroni]
MRPPLSHRHSLLRLLALVWLAAALLAGCSQEPKQRAAFISFLQTRILDRPGATIPLLGKEDREQLGDDYANQYAVIQTFHEALNDSVSKPARALLSKGSFHSVGDIMKRREDIKTMQEGVQQLRKALDENLAKADAAHAAMKQPEDLKAVFDKAYAKTVTVPANAFKDTFPAIDAMFGSVGKVVAYLDAHRDQIKVSGAMLEVSDPKLQAELQALLNDLNSKGQAVNAAQDALLKAVNRS